MSSKLQISILLLSQFLIIACLDMADPYWPLIIRHIGPINNLQNLALWTTVIYMTPFFVTVLAAPLWGYIGKYLGYKKMIIRASFVLALTQLLICMTHSLSLILILRLIQGGFAGFTASAQAWLICSSHEEKHDYLIGKVQAFMAMGTIFGPILGGLISYYFSYTSIFLISGIICSFITALLFFSLAETNKLAFRKPNRLKMPKLKGISSASSFLLAFIGLSQILRWMSSSFFALYVLHDISGSNLTIGVLYGTIALMIYISAPNWGKLAYMLRQKMSLLKLMLLICIIFSAFSQILYAEAKTVYLAILASCIWGICLGALNSIPFSLLIKYSSYDNKGLVIGLGSSASKLGNFIGIGIGGYIYALSGVHMCFGSIAIGYMIAFIFVLGGFVVLLKQPSNNHSNELNATAVESS